MNDMENLRTFADQLWKYMVPKLDSKFASNVSYFRAQVVSNPGNNKLEVQRPVENGTLTLPCVDSVAHAQPGQQVVALVMGSMSNAIVIGDGKLNPPLSTYGPASTVTLEAGKGGMPFSKLVSYITAVQEGSGDPSPSNIRPISGWTGAKVFQSGKNILSFTKFEIIKREYGITFDVVTNENGDLVKIVANGTDTSTSPYFSQVYIQVPASYARHFSGKILTGGAPNLNIQLENAYSPYTVFAKDSGSGATISSGITGARKVNIICRVPRGATVSNLEIFPMIRETGTDATYEPCQGKFIDYTFPTEAGTVYGGTLDVLKGTLTVDRASVTITGGLRYYQEHTNHYRFIFNALDGKAEPNSTSKLLSDIGVPISAQGFSSASVGVYIGNGNAMGSLYLNKSLVSPNNESANAWVASHPVQIVYPLETPITYQLTPELVATLAGQNNFWADCGDVTVEYGAFLAAEAEARNIASDILDANKSDKDHTHQLTRLTGVLPISMGGTSSTDGRIHVGTPDWGTIGLYSTSEGYETNASGQSSHAEGQGTTASGGVGSHAEGFCTEAKGTHGSHAEGAYTIAAGRTQHVFGRYNISDTTSVEIVGWGTSSTRKNIRTLSTTGNEWIAGTLTQASDARLKDVQGEIPDLSSIRAVRFRWKNGDDKEHLGYLAQDVEGVAPYLVGVDSNGYKSLDYIALLTAKVEMLEREIEKLKGR